MMFLIIFFLIVPFFLGVGLLLFRRFALEDYYHNPNKLSIGYIIWHVIVFLLPGFNYILFVFDLVDIIMSPDLYLRDCKFFDWLHREV